MKNILLRLAFILVALASLAACSSSNNLANPSNAVVTATSCDPTQAGCIEGQLVDEVVQGLDYSCANGTVSIHSLTDASGFFTCPTGSTVTFFVGAGPNPNTGVTAFPNNEIILGQAVMNPRTVPSAVSGASGGSGIVEITPLDLASMVPSTAVPGSIKGTVSQTQYATNLIRFLKTLDQYTQYAVTPTNCGPALNQPCPNPQTHPAWNDSANYVNYGAGNVIVIGSYARAVVGSNSAFNTTVSDFQGADLSSTLYTFLGQANPQQTDLHMSASDIATVTTQFTNSLNTLNAGVYIANGALCSATSQDPGLFDYGMCNIGSGRQAGDMVLFVDRTGYATGFGVTSPTANITSTSAAPAPFYVQGVTNVSTTSTSGPAVSQPIYVNFADTSKPLGTFDLLANADPAAPNAPSQSPAQIELTGIMSEGSIASTLAVFHNIYGSGVVPISSGPYEQLGQWTYKSSPADSVNDVTSGGQYFMFNSKPANPILNNTVWTALTFPIQLDLTFWYNNSAISTATSPPASTCGTDTSDPATFYCNNLLGTGTSATFPISILQNGNIITRLGSGCNTSFADHATDSSVSANEQGMNGPVLVDTSNSSNTMQYRIGFVSTVTSANELSLTLMFPHTTKTDTSLAIPSNLQGVLAGINGSARVILPTSQSTGETAYTIAVPTTSATAPTTWGNYFNSVSSSLSGLTTAGGDLGVTSGVLAIAHHTTTCT